MARAMFTEFSLFTKREVKSIWDVTNDLRAGRRVASAKFDHACELLDKFPDLKYDELRALAVFHGIIEEVPV